MLALLAAADASIPGRLLRVAIGIPQRHQRGREGIFDPGLIIQLSEQNGDRQGCADQLLHALIVALIRVENMSGSTESPVNELMAKVLLPGLMD